MLRVDHIDTLLFDSNYNPAFLFHCHQSEACVPCPFKSVEQKYISLDHACFSVSTKQES